MNPPYTILPPQPITSIDQLASRGIALLNDMDGYVEAGDIDGKGDRTHDVMMTIALIVADFAASFSNSKAMFNHTFEMAKDVLKEIAKEGVSHDQVH